jgi:hypothetical protein
LSLSIPEIPFKLWLLSYFLKRQRGLEECSTSRAHAWQTTGPEFKAQYHQNKIKKETLKKGQGYILKNKENWRKGIHMSSFQ